MLYVIALYKVKFVRARYFAAFSTPNRPAVAIDTFQLDAFDDEAERTLVAHLSDHLSEIEGDSQHGGSAWAGP